MTGMKMNRRNMISFGVAILLMGVLCAPAASYDPSMGDYTAYPLFISQAVKPSILIILDNSGSMNFMAYGYHEDGAYHPDDFGAIADGIAEGGGNTSLIDNDAKFTSTVSVGDVVHNIDDGSTGVVTGITDDHTLQISGGMSSGSENASGERYWIEHTDLKAPPSVEDGYYGYFVPTARYRYANNVFWRDDADGQWSGTFLNWLTMRRIDVARKVLMGGLATSRTGGGNQHLIGESPAQAYRKFLKVVEDPSGHSPYDNRHFYKIANGYIEVYRIDDTDPTLDYSLDFTTLSITSSGNDHTLADYVFDYIGNNTYEIRWRDPIVSGIADGLIDRNSSGGIDQNSSYRYYLFDPSQNFMGVVKPGDYFVNDSEGSTGYVTAIPATVDELLGSLPAEILYDMFHDDEDGNDGYVVCRRYCEPDVEYLPCQDDEDFAECMADGDLQSALAPLIGHLVIFSTPLDPWGPNSGEAYHFERTIRATMVDRLKIEVERNQDYPDEARDFVDGNLAGVLQKIGDRARFGLEFYNYSQGGKVVQYVGSNIRDLINRIENTGANTWTPLAESLYEGVRYFQQVSPYYYNGDYNTNNTWDPFYFNDLQTFVECSRAFVLQITDGESTQDLDIPGELQDFDGDGRDPGTYPSNGSDYLDDVALWARTTDLRPDLPDDWGPQTITYYTVFAFGRGSRLLQDAAKNGGFWDLNGDNLPGPDSKEWDRDGNGVPDTYFEAPSGFELESKIFEAITAILKRAASGTSVAVLSTSERGEGTIYQAFFRPQVIEGTEEIKWLGYLQSLWVDSYGNIREDTVADGRLVLSEDRIIRYRFDNTNMQTIVDRFSDADGDGLIDNLDTNGDPIPDDSILLEDFQGGIWEAGRLLAQRSPDDRRIFTFVDSDWDGVVDPSEQIEFSLSNLTQLQGPLDVLGELSSSYSFLGAETQRAQNLIRFIRGEEVEGLRSRTVTVGGSPKVWKLGDIVFSTPTPVSFPQSGFHTLYSDQSYFEFLNRWKDREGMVFVGANDGMLHAFKAGRLQFKDDPLTDKTEVAYFSSTDLGKEVWAYVPFNLLPHLKWLADPDYTHVYYVDLKARVADAKIFSPDSIHVNGWGTILVGGMRLGGGPYPSRDGNNTYRSAYFIIDITDPDNPQVLAEFSHPNMGYTISYPTVIRTGGMWSLVMGSGPTPGPTPPYRYDGTSDQQGRIFVLNLNAMMSSGKIQEGQELFVIQANNNDAFMADPIGVDMLLDYDTEVIYIGETYWASNKWKGTMYRVLTNNSADPSSWVLTELFSTQNNQPITAPPSVAMGFNNDLWVFFGTGRFLNEEDKVDQNTQSFYGIHDPCPSGGSCDAISINQLLDVSDAVVGTDQSVSGVSAASTFSELEALFRGSFPSYWGWWMDLPYPRERSLSKPRVIGGAVLFTTYIPDFDLCSIGGDGRLYGLYFLTGTAHPDPILDENSGISVKSVDLGKGLPASMAIHLGKESGATSYTQSSTGNVYQRTFMPPLLFKSGTVSWRQP
jgi:type IV pilus assembly protein PilY1